MAHTAICFSAGRNLKRADNRAFTEERLFEYSKPL